MVGAGNPYRAVVLEFVPAQAYPTLVEVVDLLRRTAPVPFALVDRHDFSGLHADAVVRQEVGRVGEYHVKVEFELWQQIKAVAV